MSAIGYARLKETMGWRGVIAARCGNTNARIDYVLDRFGAETPLFISDITPKVRDIMTRKVVSVPCSEPLVRAIDSIEQKQLRGLPVVDANGGCLGLLSTFKITQYLFPDSDRVETVRFVLASLSDIIASFGGQLLVGAADQAAGEYRLMVGAMRLESLAARIANYRTEQIVMFAGDREDIQLLAIERGMRAVVVTGGYEPSETILEAARKAGVVVASSPHDTASTLALARGAIQVRNLIDEEMLTFTPDTTMDSARRRAGDSAAYVFPVVDGDGILCGILSKSDFLRTVPRQLILVDHNELAQAVAGAAKIPIVEILDHHKIGGFHSDRPVLFWNNPLGSTSTIVALAYAQNGVAIPKGTAGLLMAGLISDTLNLSSPTTTDIDRQVMKTLAEIEGVQAAELAESIFSVGSPLLTLCPDEAVALDCKHYEENQIAFSVAQIEELGFDAFYPKQDDLLTALAGYREKQRLDAAFLLVTDINRQDSILLACGPEWLLDTIDYPVRGGGTWRLDGVVSRKKQLLPYLLECIHQAERSGEEESHVGS